AVSYRSGVDQWHVLKRPADPSAAVCRAAVRGRCQARIQHTRVCAAARIAEL
ncbi:hypothetical protein IWW55_004336, partial [Coemansia sp. RSA 2706]